MFKKRGQITAFIILGLLLVLGIGLYIFMNQKYFNVSKGLNIDNVRGKVELCISQNTEKALDEIGRKNGYVYDSDFAKSISTNDYGMNNTIIKEQIEKYLEDNLPECINNFEDLKEDYYIKYGDDFGFDIIYEDENIEVDLDYHIEVSDSLGELTKSMDEFKVRVPVRLKLILELMDKIKDKEKKEGFLQNLLLKKLQLPIKQRYQSDVEYKKLLVDFVAVSSKNLLKSIQVGNTDYEKDENDIVWSIGGEIYPATSVVLGYERLPLEFNNPSFQLKQDYNKELLKFTNYLDKEAFDIDFSITIPISIKVNDKLSFNKKGYVFGFVIPVYLDFSQTKEIVEGREFDLDINYVLTDKDMATYSEAHHLTDEQAIIQVNGDDFYDAAYYPYDKTITMPQKGVVKVLLFKDYELIGGYKSGFDSVSGDTLKLNAIKFSDVSESGILKKIDDGGYLGSVGLGFE